MKAKYGGGLCICTDWEKVLGDAFMHEFHFSQCLTCFIHVRRNLKDKLVECNISVDLSQRILDDRFGKMLGSVVVEGIVDASRTSLKIVPSRGAIVTPSAANVESS